MTAQKILALVEEYRAYLRQHDFEKIGDVDDDSPYVPILLMMRCHTILDDVEKLVKEAEMAMRSIFEEHHIAGQDKMEEARHWLGFVQGCLCSTGAYSLKKLKSHIRC